MEKIIDCWNRNFDAIYAINYVGYKNRKIKFLNELDRVGITKHKNFILRETVNNNWFGPIVDVLRRNRVTNLTSAGTFSLCMGHYYCMQHAHINGYNRILILEDDIRFLKELDKICDIVEHMPDDFELLFFDKFPDTTREKLDDYKIKNKYDDYYCRLHNDIEMFSTGCYALNKSGIEKLFDMYNKTLMVTDGYFIHMNAIKYFSYTNLAVQLTYGKSMSVSSGDDINCVHNRYLVDRIDYKNYNMREDGSEYNYGDFINEEN